MLANAHISYYIYTYTNWLNCANQWVLATHSNHIYNRFRHLVHKPIPKAICLCVYWHQPLQTRLGCQQDADKSSGHQQTISLTLDELLCLRWYISSQCGSTLQNFFTPGDILAASYFIAHEVSNEVIHLWPNFLLSKLTTEIKWQFS